MKFRYYIIFLFTLSFSICLKAQIVLKTFVSDSISKTPIPYATIKILNKNMGSFTGEDGRFEINSGHGDSISITCVGYKSKVVVIKRLIDTIYLAPIIKEMTPVLISNKPKIETVNGLIGYSTDINFHLSIFIEYAVKIDLPVSVNDYRISKVLFKIKKFDISSPVKLHIYSQNNSGFPGEELLTQNILLNESEIKKGILEVDIKHLNIYSDSKSLFVGFEWAGKKEDGSGNTSLCFTNSKPGVFTYTRTLLDPKYQWMLIDNRFIGKNYSNPPNLIASIVIESTE